MNQGKTRAKHFWWEKRSWEKPKVKLAHFYSTVKNMFFSTIPGPLFMVFNTYL